MRRWVVLLAIAVTACTHSSSAPVARYTASPSAEQISSPAASPSPPATSPTADASPIIDLNVTTVGFSCRLAIVTAGAHTVDSFISFPSGVVTIDPTGNHGLYYDRAFSRWLPVSGFAVSSDGAHYAEAGIGQSTEILVTVTDVATGQHHVFHEAATQFGGQPFVLDYSADGIYLVNGFEHLLAGLWLVNPTDGSMRQVSKDLYPISSAGSGVFWTQMVNPADPNPVETGTSIGTLPNEIDRVDLRSGKTTQWLYEPGKGVNLLGFDGHGSPLIETGGWTADFNSQLLLVAAPDSPTLIYKGVVAQEMSSSAVTDAHGTWLGSQRGIYLYTNAGTLLKVSDHPGYVSLASDACF